MVRTKRKTYDKCFAKNRTRGQRGAPVICRHARGPNTTERPTRDRESTRAIRPGGRHARLDSRREHITTSGSSARGLLTTCVPHINASTLFKGPDTRSNPGPSTDRQRRVPARALSSSGPQSSAALVLPFGYYPAPVPQPSRRLLDLAGLPAPAVPTRFGGSSRPCHRSSSRAG